MSKERPVVRLSNRVDAEAWFEAHHADSDGAWMAIAEKGSSVHTPNCEDLVEVALTYGWIDSQRKRLDDDCSLLAFTPRRAGSPWSQVNVEKAKALIAAGLMRPAGLAAIEVAKANGRWDAAYARSSEARVPADFLETLSAGPAAEALFATLGKQNTFAVYYRLNHAKRPETRAQRISAFIEMFERGEKLH